MEKGREVKPEDINMAIAGHLGWTDVHVYEDDAGPPIHCGSPPKYWPLRFGMPDSRIPNFCGDLNAMADAEKAAFNGNGDLWSKYLHEELPPVAFPAPPECAPAPARAKAFLRTIGKWREE